MMRDSVSPLLVDLQYVAAGLTAQLSLQSYLAWRRKSSGPAALWFCLLCGTLSAALLANVWVFRASADQIDAALLVRSALLMAALSLIVPTLARLGGQRPAPWGAWLLAALGAVRLVLWVTTDQVYAHQLDADGAPVYGRWVALLTFPYVALVVICSLMLIARWEDLVERSTLMAGTAVSLAIGTAAMVCSNAALAELLTGYWIIPWVVALQIVSNRRVNAAKLRERLTRHQRQVALAQLANSESRTRLALQAGAMAWYEWRPATRTFEGSPELAALLDVDHDHGPMTFEAVRARVHPEDRAEVEVAMLAALSSEVETAQLRWIRVNGTMIWVETSARAYQDENDETKVVGIVRDITQERQTEVELLRRARHDDLTGLANRAALNAALDEALAMHRPFALLLMDLDGFKDVNDTLGHTVGDKVLVGVSRRLSYSLSEHHQLARLGGDEFAVLVPEGHDGPERVAGRILSALESPLDVDGVAITVRASIGIARAPGDGTDAETLLRRADSAMYQAKKRGSTWHLYTTNLDRQAARRLRLAGELPEALLNGQILVHYQPTVALPTGRCHGLEALVRWNHPELGLISPVEFVPLAEHYGLGPSLARHVMAAAVNQCQRWRADGLADIVAVNVSPHTLMTPAFVHQVAATLHAARLPKEALVLELTEDVFADESGELLDALFHLKALGVGLTIDDFGTGYSSLAYLKRLPVSSIKLDCSFTAGLGTDEASDAIVSFTVELAHRLGLTVVAEGVETPEALAALARYRCDFAQGFHICRPGPAAEITDWLSCNEEISFVTDVG